jgi:putative nucleotidyltransferase with HDIG domain
MTHITNGGLPRDDGLSLLKTHLKNDKLVAHCLASEAIMRALAGRLDQNAAVWGLAGLLHDIDYEVTGEDPQRHGLEAEILLSENGIDSDITTAVKRHNAEGLGLERSSVLDHALACAESITGLIVAVALVYPDKKIASVKPKSVTKRMKTRHFARAVSRERIMECEQIGIPLNEFVALSIDAMSGIADELGL